MSNLRSEFIPAVEAGSRRLLIALHGLGDSSAGYRWMPEELNLPRLNYRLVNAPDFYYGGFSWFDFEGDMRPGIERSRKLLTTLLDESREAGYPSEQTVLFGFSQGCLMTLETGLRYPHRLAALIGISGWLPEYQTLLKELSPVARFQRILVTHGTADPLLEFSMVKSQMLALKTAGLNLTWKEFPKAHTIHGQAEVGLVRDFISQSFETPKS